MRKNVKSAQLINHYFIHGSKSFKVAIMKCKPLTGLGNPPIHYTNNANESVNARIKAKVDYLQSELSAFCESMKGLIERQN